MQKYLLLFTSLLLANCTTPKTQNKQFTDLTKKPMIGNMACIALYNPVCGTDGKTYSNSCNAQNAGVNYTLGECEAKK